MSKNMFTIYTLLFIALLTSCKKEDIELDIPSQNSQNIELLQVVDDYDHTTSNELTFNIEVLNYDNTPITNADIRVYTEVGGQGITKGQTLSNGRFQETLFLSQQVSKVYVEVLVSEIPNRAIVSINKDGEVNHTFGGEQAAKDLHGGLNESAVD